MILAAGARAEKTRERECGGSENEQHQKSAEADVKATVA
jgi:hypothetical protein